ncbi:MAG: transglutaminase family protein [Candidatus Hermodarchaeota archaeon]
MLDVVLLSPKPVSLKKTNVKITPKDRVLLEVTTNTMPVSGLLSLRNPFQSNIFTQKINMSANNRISYKLKLDNSWDSGLYFARFQDYSSNKHQEIGFFIQTPQEVTPQWKLSYQVKVTNTSDPTVKFILYLALPFPYIANFQQVKESRFSYSDVHLSSDLNGNQWLTLERTLQPRESWRFSYEKIIETQLTSYDSKTLSPDHFSGSSLAQKDLEPFLKPEKGIESDYPKIIEFANQIQAMNTSDFVLKAVKEIQKQLKYEIQKGEFGAKWAIETGRGDCTEFAALLVALCRAKNIPARTIAGFASNGTKWERHAAVEVFLGGQWIPIDPSIISLKPFFGLRPTTLVLFRGNWMGRTFHKEILYRTSSPTVKIEPSWRIDRFSKVRLLNDINSNKEPIIHIKPTQTSPKVEIGANIPEIIPAGHHRFKITIKNNLEEFEGTLDAQIEVSGYKMVLYKTAILVPSKSRITKDIEIDLPILAMPILLIISLRSKTSKLRGQIQNKISIY